MTQDPFYQPQSPSPNYYGTPKQNDSNKKTIIIILVIVALLLCCCCAVAAFLWTFGDQIVYELGLNILNVLIR